MSETPKPTKMTTPQKGAFWVWYSTGLNGNAGKRSYRKAAEVLPQSAAVLRGWGKEHDWKTLAEAEDEKIIRAMDKGNEALIIKTFQAALDRQRRIMSRIYKLFEDKLDRIDPEDMKIGDLIKAMEYETNYIFDEQRGNQKGTSLAQVLALLPSEVRTQFHAAVEQLESLGDRVGPERSN